MRHPHATPLVVPVPAPSPARSRAVVLGRADVQSDRKAGPHRPGCFTTATGRVSPTFLNHD